MPEPESMKIFKASVAFSPFIVHSIGPDQWYLINT